MPPEPWEVNRDIWAQTSGHITRGQLESSLENRNTWGCVLGCSGRAGVYLHGSPLPQVFLIIFAGDADVSPFSLGTPMCLRHALAVPDFIVWLSVCTSQVPLYSPGLICRGTWTEMASQGSTGLGTSILNLPSTHWECRFRELEFWPCVKLMASWVVE